MALTTLAVSLRAQVPPPPGPGAGGLPGQPPGVPVPGDPGFPGAPDELPGSADAIADYGRAPVKIVAGRLVVHCEISTIHRRLPVNLFVDYENPCGLQLHNNAAGPLRAENQAGQSIPITVHFPTFRFVVPAREQGPQKDWEEFTRLYSREIGDDALVGTIGAKILRSYRVVFDLARGAIELLEASPPRDPDSEPPLPPAEEAGAIELSITSTDDIVWLPVQLPAGKITAMALSTSSYDSLVDAEWCDELGAPAGDVKPLKLGTLDLSSFVALRPSEVNYVHPDGAFGVLGLGALEKLRVEIDRENATARIEVSAELEYPQADFEFFRASTEEEAESLERYLESHPDARLSQEAARLLVGYRIDENAPHEAFEKAIRFLHATWREDIVSTRALDLMRELRAAGQPLAAVFAGELGVEGGRKDRYPESVHRLHGSMGEILLDAGEDRRAWRHLLSAAFGLPEDGRINLKLGEFYERQERHRRALSRYLQAVISVDSGEKALAGLERVQARLGDSEQLSVDSVEALIAGKIYGYSAPTRYRPEPREDDGPRRVALVEFFTNAHIKHPTRDEGAIGGALGNEGLLTYFSRNDVAALAYHLEHPELDMDSLTNPVARYHADFYGAPPAVQIVSGTGQAPGVGKAREAEQIYKQGRAAVLQQLAKPTAYEIEIDARLEGEQGSVHGEVIARGPSAPALVLHVILAERGVLYPGKSKVVIHRMVARAALTRRISGEHFAPDQSGAMKVSIEASLAQITRANEAYLDELEARGQGGVRKFAARMDPRQLEIVAFLQDGSTREVLQAMQLRLRNTE